MLVYGNFSPFSIYTSVHEIIRLAFPGCKILTSEPMEKDDNRITINLTEQGNKVVLYGRVQIGLNSTVLNQEWELNGSQARNNEVKKLARRFTYLLLEKHLKRKLSNYGILTGVRPVKLVHRLWDQGYSEPEIIEIMKRDYLISQEKAELLMEIAGNNRPYLLTPESARKCVSIYIGIPFCLSRCYYCSFPGAVLNDYNQQITPFIETLVKEMTLVGDYINHHGFNVQTIYLGGGTPTVLNEKDLALVFHLLHQRYISSATTEITVEAGRPDTITLSKLKLLKEAGVNRVCINPQTTNDHTLQTIGRNHNYKEVINAFQLAREVGINCINMDIIAGLPGEGPQENYQTVKSILGLRPENITVHTLALKRGSQMAESEARKDIEDRASEVKQGISLFDRVLRDTGYQPYYLYRQKYMKANMENTGYSIANHFCLYNIQMIEERQTIIGLGGGCRSKFVNPMDWTFSSVYNPKDPKAYSQSIARLLSCKVDKLNTLN